MTNEEKDLLIKDLIVRFLYNVKCKVWFNEDVLEGMTLKTSFPNSFGKYEFYNEKMSCYSDKFKPYLRSLSNMTKKEKEEFNLLGWKVDELDNNYPWVANGNIENILSGLDWLNAHHFDYHGLIEKGLALEAPEGMYNF